MKYKKPIAIALIAGLLGFAGCASQPVPDGVVRNNVRSNVSRSINDGRSNTNNRYNNGGLTNAPRYSTGRDGLFNAVRNSVNRPARDGSIGRTANHATNMGLIKDMDGSSANRSASNTNSVTGNQTAPGVYGNKAVTRQAVHKAPIRTTPPQNVIKRNVEKTDGQTSNVTRKTPTVQHSATNKAGSKATTAKPKEAAKPVTRKAPAVQHSTANKTTGNTPAKKHEAVKPVADKAHSTGETTTRADASQKHEAVNRTTNQTVARKSPIRKHIQVRRPAANGIGHTTENVPIRPDGTYTPFVSRVNPDGTINNRIVPRSKGTGEVVYPGYPINQLRSNEERYNGHTVHYDADGYVVSRSIHETANPNGNAARYSIDNTVTNRNERRAARNIDSIVQHGTGSFSVTRSSNNRNTGQSENIWGNHSYGTHNTGRFDVNRNNRRTNRPQNARYDHTVQRNQASNNAMTNAGNTNYHSAGFNVMNLPNWNII